MPALFAYLAAQATVALKRAIVIYGLMAIVGLIALFAMGYALDAGHTALALRYGIVAASLTIAAALLFVAIGCTIAALAIRQRPGSIHAATAPFSPAPNLRPYSARRVLALAAFVAGAGSMSAALIRFNSLRSWLRRH